MALFFLNQIPPIPTVFLSQSTQISVIRPSRREPMTPTQKITSNDNSNNSGFSNFDARSNAPLLEKDNPKTKNNKKKEQEKKNNATEVPFKPQENCENIEMLESSSISSLSSSSSVPLSNKTQIIELKTPSISNNNELAELETSVKAEYSLATDLVSPKSHSCSSKILPSSDHAIETECLDKSQMEDSTSSSCGTDYLRASMPVDSQGHDGTFNENNIPQNRLPVIMPSGYVQNNNTQLFDINIKEM